MAEKHRIYYAGYLPDLNGMHAAHDELWTWLADNPDKSKEDWPEWEGHTVYTGIYNNTNINAHCFLCEAMRGNCEACPLTQDIYPECTASGSLYNLWRHAKRSEHYRIARELALQIRDAWRQHEAH